MTMSNPEQTYTDDQKREIALGMAVKAAAGRETSATDIVEHAEKFHTFLDGATQQDSEG